MRVNNTRKYRFLYVLVVLLVILLAVPVTGVGATVYLPPTPVPKERFSISGVRVLAARQPGDILIPGYDGSGGPSRSDSKQEIEDVETAMMKAAYDGVPYASGGGKKAVAKDLPETEVAVPQISKQMHTRLVRAAEDMNRLWNKASTGGDNTWFMGCLDQGVCYQ